MTSSRIHLLSHVFTSVSSIVIEIGVRRQTQLFTTSGAVKSKLKILVDEDAKREILAGQWCCRAAMLSDEGGTLAAPPIKEWFKFPLSLLWSGVQSTIWTTSQQSHQLYGVLVLPVVLKYPASITRACAKLTSHLLCRMYSITSRYVEPNTLLHRWDLRLR